MHASEAKQMLKMSSFGTNTRTHTFNCATHQLRHRWCLSQDMPHIDKTLLQFIQVMNFCLVDISPHIDSAQRDSAHLNSAQTAAIGTKFWVHVTYSILLLPTQKLRQRRCLNLFKLRQLVVQGKSTIIWFTVSNLAVSFLYFPSHYIWLFLFLCFFRI